MKLLFLIANVVLLSSCQTLQPNSNDPGSLNFNIPNGSTLILNKDIRVAKDHTHVTIQSGQITSDKHKNLYDLSCSFEMEAFGPRTIKPDTFSIRRTEDGQEEAGAYFINYYTDIYLYSDHNSDIIKLACSVWGDEADDNFTVADIQQTLGSYFSFDFAQPDVSGTNFSGADNPVSAK